MNKRFCRTILTFSLCILSLFGNARSNISSADTVVSVTTALSIDLIFFKAEQKGDFITLNWQMASEVNNSHFELLRSLDGKDFEPISILKCIENSSQNVSYSFEDTQILNFITSKVYYRLKQIDHNGLSGLSKMISINLINRSRFDASLFLDPSRAELNIEFLTEREGQIDVKIVSSSETTYISSHFYAVRGSNKVRLSVIDLAKGTYVVSISDGTITEDQKIIKK